MRTSGLICVTIERMNRKQLFVAFFAAVALILAPCPPAPAAEKPRDVSPTLRTIIQTHNLPGMVAAVVDVDAGGPGYRLTAAGAAGVRRRGSPEPVTLNDQFHIGSDTKSMTATLCAMLVEEGKFPWDQTLANAFPELKTRMHLDYQHVTLEQLLHHRGGCPGDLAKDPLWAKLWQYHGTPSGARKLLVEGVLIQPPEAPPGSKYIYSNAGFAIAGHIAEKAAGHGWEDLMRTRLFKPLGMTSAGFGPPQWDNPPDPAARRAPINPRSGASLPVLQPRGHHADGTPEEPGPGADNPTAIGPAGTVHVSLPDWAKYIAFHVSNGKTHPGLLKPEAFDKLHSPYKGEGEGGYAMGWLVVTRPWAGGTALNHAGSNTMWYAVAWLAPKKHFAVLVATNQGGDEAAKACDEAASEMIGGHGGEH